MNQILSIIIPAHNEEKTVYTILKKVVEIKLPKNIDKEIFIINDFSTDKTEQEAKRFIKDDAHKTNIKYLANEKNLGKSQTVKRGMLLTKGDYVIVQDADLETDPQDIGTMLTELLDKDLDFILGDRFGKQNNKGYKAYYVANKSLTFFTNVFVFLRTGKAIPDMEVCYKLMKGDIAREIAAKLVSRSLFGLEPEIVAYLTKYKTKEGKRLKFSSLPISYFPRTIEQGKHMRIKDGFKAVYEIIRFNI